MSKPQYLIIGLDGIPYTLLTDLCDRGVTPNLAALMKRGQSKPIRSVLPDVSSTAWTSFMTGTNPGEHGIYGFFVPQPDDYSLRFLNADDIQVPTLWERLGRLGKKSLVVNVPQTYPAREINGVLISGFVAPELEKAVWPRTLLAELKDLEYTIDVDAWKAREDLSAFVADLFGVLETRIKTLEYLWEKESWDLIMAVITGTDRLQHYLWHILEDERSGLHSTVLDFYQAVDSAVGKLVDRVNKSTRILVLSDHGFSSVQKEINLNAWLRSTGYLSFRTDSPKSLQEMNSESIAFTLDPGRIYLNRADRFRNGWIARGREYNEIREELRERLLHDISIRDEVGALINPVSRVFLPDEVYAGPQVQYAPDLIVLNKPGYDLKGSVKITEIARNDVLTGMHTYENASLVVVNTNKTFNIDGIDALEDIVPKILWDMGIEE